MRVSGMSRRVWSLVAVLVCLAVSSDCSVSSSAMNVQNIGLRTLLKQVVTEAVREHCPGKSDCSADQVRTAAAQRCEFRTYFALL